MRTRNTRSAFTLVEILIVVVILGILASIVIPQYTDASQEASDANLRSQLQIVRGQIGLFNVKRPDPGFGVYDGGTPLAGFWDGLVDNDYLQQVPRNPFAPPAQATLVGAVPAGVGWVWDGTDLFATDGAGAIYTE